LKTFALIGVAFFAISSPALAQGFLPSAYISVYGTGFDQSCTFLDAAPASFTFVTDSPDTTPGNPGYLVQSCGSYGDPRHPNSLVDSYAVTSINRFNGNIGAGVTASATGGYLFGASSGAPNGAATAITRWSDTAYLKGSSALPDYLSFEFVLDGTINAAYVDDSVGSSNDEVIYASLSVLADPSVNSSDACLLTLNTPNPWSIYPYQPSLCPPERTTTGVGGVRVIINHSYSLTDRPTGAYDFSYALDAFASATSGNSISDFISTLGLKAVYLPDGSTPESQGWNLEFVSGIRSPNLSAQPPVGTPLPIPILGLGAGYAWSRKIRKKIRKTQKE